MADNGTSVGVINLGLTVVDTCSSSWRRLHPKRKSRPARRFPG